MIHSIKRRTYIEEGKEGDLILIDGRVNVGENSEYGCFCGMISAETGLEFWKQTISRQVTSELVESGSINFSMTFDMNGRFDIGL